MPVFPGRTGDWEEEEEEEEDIYSRYSVVSQ
jgi:hypothetical protein